MVALDGAVQGPQIDKERCRYSFDHHAGCVRVVTSATCEQVADAILLGLDPREFTVYVNDVNGDTVLSTWLLLHPDRVGEEMVQKLIRAVGKTDSHGPAYPSPNPELGLGFFRGVMAPLGRVLKSEATPTEETLWECVGRVDSLLSGEIEISPVEEGFINITHRGTGGWVMAEAEGFGFDALYKQGINRAVVYSSTPSGGWRYTVWKRSEFVSGFPVGPGDKPGTIIHTLSGIEPGWGGGSTIGGYPRTPKGSKLSPDEVFNLIEGIVKGEAAE